MHWGYKRKSEIVDLKAGLISIKVVWRGGQKKAKGRIQGKTDAGRARAVTRHSGKLAKEK